MKYLKSDYDLLNSIPEKVTDTLGNVYERMCCAMLVPVTMPCLLHALRGLSASGYVTVQPENGVFTAATPISMTEAGCKAVKISGVQKLLGEEKAALKKERSFCGLEYPVEVGGADWTVESEGFEEIVKELRERRDLTYPMFEVTDLGDGFLKLTVHHPNDDPLHEEDGDEADYDPDAAAVSYSASVTGSTEQITAGIRDLIAAAHGLVTEPPRTRKVALHGSDGSLLISLALAANEQGLVTFRMTLSKIRFNRQRFFGKRDSDLDYAQCGDPIFILEMSSAESFAYYGVLPCGLGLPHLLDEEDLTLLGDIHRSLR